MRIVIVGGGFGGIFTAKQLKDSSHEVIILDRTNYHLFQPLLYQVATAALSPADIAVPIRSIFSEQKNITVLMEEVYAIDKEKKEIQLKDRLLQFDSLVLAPGARHSYFGNSNWEKFAPGLKTLEDALEIRERILLSLEKAETTESEYEKRKNLTFVLIGGGPTGVEMAGSIAEIVQKAILKDFRKIRPQDARVILIEGQNRILTSYDKKLSAAAENDLRSLGVEVIKEKFVKNIDANSVSLDGEIIHTSTIVWAAGNEASPLLKSLNTPLDRAGRAIVQTDLSIPAHDKIFVIGDAANFKEENEKVLPGVCQVAMQMGTFVGKILRDDIPKERRGKFKYNDKGSMATIGRAKAIAEVYGIKLSGFIAWLAWGLLHIFFLIGFRNRVRVMLEWIWQYVTFRRGIRLITGRWFSEK